jgi:hypothetical protein
VHSLLSSAGGGVASPVSNIVVRRLYTLTRDEVKGHFDQSIRDNGSVSADTTAFQVMERRGAKMA